MTWVLVIMSQLCRPPLVWAVFLSWSVLPQDAPTMSHLAELATSLVTCELCMGYQTTAAHIHHAPMVTRERTSCLSTSKSTTRWHSAHCVTAPPSSATLTLRCRNISRTTMVPTNVLSVVARIPEHRASPRITSRSI